MSIEQWKQTFENGLDRRGSACIKWDFQEMDYGRSGLLPFSIADADYPVYPAVLEAIHQRVDQGVIGYTDLNDDYFGPIAGWIARRHHFTVDHSWIVPTGGIVPAMCNAIEALLAPDAKVIVQPPVYDPFYSVIRASGRTMVENPLLLDADGYHMDFAGLEKCCADGAAMLLFCSPHNPVCRVWTREELQRLADICEKYDVLIVSDEIHWDLMIGGSKHVSLGEFPQIYEQLVLCTSCSKTFNIAGLETSNLIIPGKTVREKYQEYLYARYLFCPNTLGMTAAAAACTSGDEWVDAQNEFLTENAQLVCRFMEQELPKVKVAKPEGTYLLWMDMRAYGKTSDELVARIAQAGAGLNSGKHYEESYDGFVRMNVACPKTQLRAGLECIKTALNNIDGERK